MHKTQPKIISTQCNTATFSDHCMLSCDYQNQTAILVEKTNCLAPAFRKTVLKNHVATDIMFISIIRTNFK